MHRIWIRGTRLFALLLPLLAQGCWSGDGPAHDPIGPAEHSTYSGHSAPYRILRGNPGSQVRTDQAVIQPSAGGSVGVAGNVLIVPKHAVSRPTLFRMTLSQREVDGTTKVQVSLRALQQDAQGGYTVNVGERGFDRKLILRLTFEWAQDAVSDPSALRIVWLRPDGTQEVYSSQVDSSGKRVESELSHFSDYGLGLPGFRDVNF